MPDVRYTVEEERLRETVASRIKAAWEEARAADPKKGPAWLSEKLGVSHSSIYRMINAEPGTDPSALAIWRLSQATGKPFGWFAGNEVSETERMALAAERAESTIRGMQLALGQLLADLAAARGEVIHDEAQLDAAVGRASRRRRSEGAHQSGEAITVTRKPAG